MRIYLCSRIAKDAHEINNSVASALRKAGHLVFVPHEMHYNQIVNDLAHTVSDQEIYEEDMAAMHEAEACVVVGRVGVDCAFEMGWFEGRNVPVLYYLPLNVTTDRHPMFYRIKQWGTHTNIDALVKGLKNAPRYTPENVMLNDLWLREYGKDGDK